MMRKLMALYILLASSAYAEEVPLWQKACPVDWRGVPAQQALDDLAGRLQIPYIIAPTVKEERLQDRVRIYAAHMTGRQVFRWLARSLGLEAVLVDDMFLIAEPKGLPSPWRPAVEMGDLVSEASDRPGLWDRRADLAWVDVPLSRVAREVSSSYGIDIIFDSRILSEQGLIHLEGQNMSLRGVCEALEAQIGAKAALYDGCLWVIPKSAEIGPKQAISQDSGILHANSQPDFFLERFVVLDRVMLGSKDWSDRWRKLCPTNIAFEFPALKSYPTIEARGCLADVLKSGELLGLWQGGD